MEQIQRVLGLGARGRNLQERAPLQFAELEPRIALAVTTAVQDGDWHDASVWDNGVPDAQTRAIIGSGVTVALVGEDHIAKELVIHGTLTALDQPAAGSASAEPIAGDYDGSQTVDDADRAAWSAGFGQAPSSPGTGADGNADNTISAADFALWRGFAGAPVVAPASSVPDRTLTADWIHVNSGGLFQIGTANDRYDEGTFTVVLTGDDPTADPVVELASGATMTITDNNAFLMPAGGGSLQFFGEEKLAFTKLSQTAEVGAAEIVVENVIERNLDGVTSAASDGQLDWVVGDEIVVASSSYDYAEEEVRTITAIQDLGDGTTRLTLDSPLAFRHYGEIETYSNAERTWDIDLRAEVAVLNRSIVIQGDENADADIAFGDRALYNSGASDAVGGHVMVMPTAGAIAFDSVQFDKLGQAGRLGRYPVHWHVGGDRTGDFLRGSSVTNSNNRGVTIHGTQNLQIQDNVLHDIHGHGFFQEDGAEFGNEFWSNIALGIHPVGGNGSNNDDPFIVPGLTRGADGKVNGQAPRDSLTAEGSSDTGQNFTDRFVHSAAYWVTNPDNLWVGNVAAGAAGTGFWFALPDSVIGLSLDTGLYDGYNPKAQRLERFDNNTSHSATVGLTFDRGEDIDPGSNNHYNPSQPPIINGLTAYKHFGSAVYHRGSNTTFNESRFADNTTSSFNTFSQIEQNILFVGHSRGNADISKSVGGFKLYDGPGQIIDSHFAGFQRPNAFTFRVEGGANKHSHTRAEGITYENDGTADYLSIEWEVEASFEDNFAPLFISGRPDSFAGIVYDVDGSLTGHLGGGAGWSLTPKIDLYRDADDLAPEGHNVYVSNDRYAQLKVGANNGETVPNYFLTNEDGAQIYANRGNLASVQRQYVKVNAGEYSIEFSQPIPPNGFSMFLEVREVEEPNDATVFRIADVATTMKPTEGTEVGSIQDVRNATSNSYFRDANGDLWWKMFSDNDTIQVRTTNDPPIPPTGDDNVAPFAMIVEEVIPAFNGTPNRFRFSAEVSDANGDPLSLFWDVIDGPGVASIWNGRETANAQANFSANGIYTVQFTAYDGAVTTTDTMQIDIQNSVATVLRDTFDAVDDAYLFLGARANNNSLRVESGSTTSYLKFDVSGLAGQTVTSARLILTESSDVSNSVDLNLHLGQSNAWTETNLNSANAPATGALVDTFSGSVLDGQFIEFDVTSAITGDGTYSFVLSSPSGNDVAFGSSESSLRPRLVIAFA